MFRFQTVTDQVKNTVERNSQVVLMLLIYKLRMIKAYKRLLYLDKDSSLRSE